METPVGQPAARCCSTASPPGGPAAGGRGALPLAGRSSSCCSARRWRGGRPRRGRAPGRRASGLPAPLPALRARRAEPRHARRGGRRPRPGAARGLLRGLGGRLARGRARPDRRRRQDLPAHARPRQGPRAAAPRSRARAARQRLVLGREAVGGKSNETAAIPLLLGRLALDGALVTIDAAGTRSAIAATVLARGGDHLLALEANRPATLEEVEPFGACPPARGAGPGGRPAAGGRRDLRHHRRRPRPDRGPPPRGVPRGRLAAPGPAPPGRARLPGPRHDRHGRGRHRAWRQGRGGAPHGSARPTPPPSPARAGAPGHRGPAAPGPGRGLPRRPLAPTHRPRAREHGRGPAHGGEPVAPRPRPPRPSRTAASAPAGTPPTSRPSSGTPREPSFVRSPRSALPRRLISNVSHTHPGKPSLDPKRERAGRDDDFLPEPLAHMRWPSLQAGVAGLVPVPAWGPIRQRPCSTANTWA